MRTKSKTAALGLVFGAVLALGSGVPAHEGHKHEEGKQAAPAADVVTLEGEVLDLSCYLAHPETGRGKEHKKCAKMCLVEKKVSAGLLTADGSVYLLVEDHDHEKAFKPVRDLAAEQVRVTGRKVSKGGVQGILVQKVEKL